MGSIIATYTLFSGSRRIVQGDRAAVSGAWKRALEAGDQMLVAFDDETGRQIDFDLRSTEEPAPRPGRGRPKLGVVAREVTLLPRHWEWLADQPGGASAALRRLVDQARKASAPADAARYARDAAYRVMSALAGDLPNFEEASRGLYGGDLDRVSAIVATWPTDVSAYVTERLKVVEAAATRPSTG